MSLIPHLVRYIRLPAARRRWISAFSVVATNKRLDTSASEHVQFVQQQQQQLTADAQTQTGVSSDDKHPDSILSSLEPSRPCKTSRAKSQNSGSKSSSSKKPRLRWSLPDKEKLVQVVEICRKAPGGLIAWPKVQQLYFQDRTAIACRDAYMAILKSNGLTLTSSASLSDHKLEISDKHHSRHLLTERERSELPRIVRKHGERNWDAVAEEMEQVAGIRRHKGVYHSTWHLHLCPRMQTAPLWDAEKAGRLKQLVAQHGKDDVFLAYKFFPEYSPAALRVMLRRMDTKLAAVDYRVGKQGIKDK